MVTLLPLQAPPFIRSRLEFVAGLARTLLLLLPFLAVAEPATPSDTARVGRTSDHRVVLPVSQVVTPAGRQVELPGLRPQALALSPNGRILVTSGKTHELVVVDPHIATVRQQVALPSDKLGEDPGTPVSSHILEPDTEGQLSFTGLAFSPDGTRLYLANVNGTVKVFGIGADDTVVPLYSIPLPVAAAPRRLKEIPAGLALSADGRKLYVAGNLSNRLIEIDTATGRTLRTFNVGVAPYDVVLLGQKAYVSNWGGRRPGTNDLTGPAGQGTRVRVDPVRHIASEGSVSVVDLTDAQPTREILTGPHACALALSPNRRHLVVANAAADTLSILDTATDSVVETVSLRWQPQDYFGATPNALCFDPKGRTLFVALGTQNAIGVLDFKPGKSRLRGLIPTGWFPGAILYDAPRRTLQVANIKQLSRGRPNARTGWPEFNSHQYAGSLSLIPVPTRRELERHTRTTLENCRRYRLEQALLPPRPDQPPRPIPERRGEPSLFKHVIYIIKENRTYDQVLGDVPQGKGDPSLCVFGERITPNQHRLVRDFVLLDNTYCSGILSADGHNWATAAFGTDYLERSFAGWPRSYPDGMDDDDVDALAYSPAGFIWDNAIAHGKTLRDYGEFAITVKAWKDPAEKRPIVFRDHYLDFTQGLGLIQISSRPAIESLRPYLATNTVGWDMDIPDVFRAEQFIRELRAYEVSGDYPQLVIVCLPNDHTSGTAAGAPTPAAQVADNDLAFGRIVEAVSHSRFWKDTCIFAIEDDPQAGWDHVSGYRTTAYVISPYTRRGAVVHTQYNQPGMLRTMELILGLPPMNQMDAIATPMFDCFTDQPDFAPYTALPNQVPLDEMNPEPQALHDSVQRGYARKSARLPLDRPDQCDEDLLNRILWHAMKGGRTPYPSWAVLPKSARDDDD